MPKGGGGETVHFILKRGWGVTRQAQEQLNNYSNQCLKKNLAYKQEVGEGQGVDVEGRQGSNHSKPIYSWPESQENEFITFYYEEIISQVCNKVSA